MRRLITVIGLTYVAVVLLLLVGDNTRSEAVACGAPSPTATSGPPTQTPVPPTASPEVYPTFDLGTLPTAKAPAGLHTIASCETRDQVVATLHLLIDLLDGWELVPIGKGPPPPVILVAFEDSLDGQRTLALNVVGDDLPPLGERSAAQRIVRDNEERSNAGASIATDGKLVWMRYKQDGRSYLTWAAIGSAREFTVIASHPADLETMVDAWARAAEHACYPYCD